MNRLYFGDNLKWLSDRKEFPGASADLVYLETAEELQHEPFFDLYENPRYSREDALFAGCYA